VSLCGDALGSSVCWITSFDRLSLILLGSVFGRRGALCPINRAPQCLLTAFVYIVGPRSFALDQCT
jgi:hypothetical protein